MTATLGLPPIREQKPIYLHNAYVVRQLIRVYSAATDAYVAWSGSPVPRVRFSVEPTGYTSEGYPSTLFGPYNLAGALVNSMYVYSYVVSADDVTQYLGTRVGQTIYQIVEGSYGTSYYDLTDVQSLLVCDPYAPLPR